MRFELLKQQGLHHIKQFQMTSQTKELTGALAIN